MSPRYHRLPTLEVEPDERGRPALLHWRGTDLLVEVCGQWRVDGRWRWSDRYVVAQYHNDLNRHMRSGTQPYN